MKMSYWDSLDCGERLVTSEVGTPANQVRKPNSCPNHPEKHYFKQLPHDLAEHDPPTTEVVGVNSDDTKDVKDEYPPKGGKGIGPPSPTKRL